MNGFTLKIEEKESFNSLIGIGSCQLGDGKSDGKIKVVCLTYES